MDEPRRFLRYIIPGLVFGVENIVFLLILFPSWTVDQLKSLQNDSALASVAAAVLVAGGLGFVFSTLHHAVHWYPWFEWLAAIDHRDLLRFLIQRGILTCYDSRDGSRMPVGNIARLKRLEAWTAVSALWHQRLGTCAQIREAHRRMGAFYDLTHALGTLRVACLAAAMSTLAVASFICEFCFQGQAILRFIIFVIIAAALLCVHQYSYRTTGRITQRFVDQILTDALIDEYCSGKPGHTQIDLNCR